MIITKKAIPRRAVLRGLGVSLALPFLDAMVPALTAMPLDALIESWLTESAADSSIGTSHAW